MKNLLRSLTFISALCAFSQASASVCIAKIRACAADPLVLVQLSDEARQFLLTRMLPAIAAESEETVFHSPNYGLLANRKLIGQILDAQARKSLLVSNLETLSSAGSISESERLVFASVFFARHTPIEAARQLKIPKEEALAALRRVILVMYEKTPSEPASPDSPTRQDLLVELFSVPGPLRSSMKHNPSATPLQELFDLWMDQVPAETSTQ